MALTGLQIYKLLPQTNCKECGFPTCLAFAMKLAAKQAELAACPTVSEEAKAQLEAASAPPVRLITVSGEGRKLEVGNEMVLFRHEKTFYRPPGLFVRIRDTQPPDKIRQGTAQVEHYAVDYVGTALTMDGVAIEAVSGDATTFAEAVSAVRSETRKPLILISRDPAILEAGLTRLSGGVPLLYAADETNWQAMAALAKRAKLPLVCRAPGLPALANLVEKVKATGVENLVLDAETRDFPGSLAVLTQIRRMAVKKNFRLLGYPAITFPGEGVADAVEEGLLAGQHIGKYASFVVLDHFSPELAYALLVLRQNIYTDPQKPIQVQPGLYEINTPTPESPVLVSTNFSITYFSVANEIGGTGRPAWLLIADAEGMSVLTAWAAGKFDAARIAKAVQTSGVAEKVNHHRLIIPGYVAVLSGELEEALPNWEVMVGPREAIDLPGFLRLRW